LRQIVEGKHHFFQAGAFASEFLGVLRIIPDGGIFQFPADFGQAFCAGIEVKGTP
jgi:hypothetical protein